MAHPVRPEAYVKMDNFYTRTVYRKGAEGELVAVATFSPRWKKRHADGSTSASHELI